MITAMNFFVYEKIIFNSKSLNSQLNSDLAYNQA